MAAVMAMVYGFYLITVGVRGNAPSLLQDVTQEGQFLYWIVVLFVLAALWETDTGEEIAKPFAALIVIGFLLTNGNYATIATNAKAILPAL